MLLSPESGIAGRIHGWSWQTFPIVMGTSAVFMTLSDLKRHPAFVSRIEMVFLVFSISLFLTNMVTLFLQTFFYPRLARSRLHDPIQGIFVPLMVVSFATIIVGTINYDVTYGHVNSNLIYALFWVYLAIAMATCFPMIKITFSQRRELVDFAPSYAFPMLTGLVSANTLRVIDVSDARALGVLLVGFVVHGLGLFMAFFFLSIYIARYHGFMESSQSNLAFVACSPPGFSALTLMSLGDHARSILGAGGYITEAAGDVWYSASVMASLLLYGLALFFLILGVIAYGYSFKGHIDGILSLGWINATRLLGDIFEAQGFLTFHLLVLSVFTATAFFQGKILKSMKEDVNKSIPNQAGEDVMEERPASMFEPLVSSAKLKSSRTVAVSSDLISPIARAQSPLLVSRMRSFTMSNL
ncbi:voltage-dependent anion channel-domain-containing protein [Armillaria nabsnona]|nr:voltage-dependent anion channel-domain-containing protein [Armillaria nabsnona]